jgi:hypothetical protein
MSEYLPGMHAYPLNPAEAERHGKSLARIEVVTGYSNMDSVAGFLTPLQARELAAELLELAAKAEEARE